MARPTTDEIPIDADEMASDRGMLDLTFSGEIWHWRGPAPHHFITVPPKESAELRAIAAIVTYGWGMIPVRARIGRSVWDTSLFAKDGGYVLPVKAVVRDVEGLTQGDIAAVRMSIRR